MNKNKIFIFEFVSGGGFNQLDVPTSLLCESFGMLRTIINDFNLLDFEIRTLLDYRIFFLTNYLQADSIKKVNVENNYIEKFKKSVKESDYIFIIAPEFSNILYDLTKIAKDNNKTILSVDLEGINLGSSKIKTYEFFKTYGVNTPRTFLIPFKNNSLDLEFIVQKLNELNCPIVIKPDDGVGAEKIYYFETEEQIIDFFKDLNEKFEINRSYILQEFIEGDDLSVSLIRTLNNPLILSINAQNLNIKNNYNESEYFGGYTPVENYVQILRNLTNTLSKLNLSKLTGYYGIDFIKKIDNTIYLIEINPRLTTSYIGIRNIVDKNIAALIYNSKLNSLNSIEINIQNTSIFSRLELNYIGNKSTKIIKEEIIPKLVSEVPELVTPPISFENSNQNKNCHYSCFITTKNRDLKSARKRKVEIINTFKNYHFTVIK